jgi:ribosomal-protein-serine acetyltransferase
LVTITINDKILLRPYEVAEAQELFDAIHASRKHLNPWLDWVSKTTKPEHSLQFIQDSLQQIHNQEALPLGIFYDNRIIGGTGLHHWDQQTRKAQIGYWLCKDFEGKGIINRSLAGFIDFLFDKIGLNKIEIHFVVPNVRSAKVATRLGFKVEGVIRQGVMRNGVLEDVVVAGLLRSEYPVN